MVYSLFSVLFYIIVYLLIVSKIKNYYLQLIVYICIVLFWGASYHYAIDTPGYMDYFNYEVLPLNRGIDLGLHHFEPGFNLFAQVCKTITGNYAFFQTCIFALDMFLIYMGLRKLFSDKSMLIVFPLLFFTFPTILNALRQSIAISFFIYALSFINQKKSWKFILWIVIGSFFHQSALFLLPFYFARFLKNSLNKRILIILILAVSDIMWLSNMSLSSNFSFWTDVLSSEYLEMGEKYMTNYILDEELESNFGIAKILEINIVALLYAFFKDKLPNNNILTSLLIVYIVVGLVFGGLFALRILYYFSVLYYACFIVSLTELLKGNQRVSYVTISIYMLWFFIFHAGYINKAYIPLL